MIVKSMLRASLLKGAVADAQMAGGCMWLSTIYQLRPDGCSCILIRQESAALRQCALLPILLVMILRDYPAAETYGTD